MFENRLQYENCREHKYFENCKKYFVSADVVLVWASNVRLFLPFGVSKNDIYLRICAIGLIYSFLKNVFLISYLMMWIFCPQQNAIDNKCSKFIFF